MAKKKRSFMSKVSYVIFGDRSEKKKRPVKRAPQVEENDEDEILEEFSRGSDDFYTDEVRQRPVSSRRQNDRKRESSSSGSGKRKPLTPAKRRLRNVLSFSIILVVIITGCLILSLTVLFKTQNFEIAGSDQYSLDELVSVSGLNTGENIFLAPRGIAERRVKENYPYIEKVEISPKIPDTMVFNITEAVEGYMVKISDSEYLVVSSQGRILDKTAYPADKGLPLFIGPVVENPEVGKYIKYSDDTVPDIISEISNSFANNGYTGITQIDASDLSALTFTYDDRILVKLGLPEDLDYKIRTAMTIITEKLDLQDVNPIMGKLDVSKCNDTKKSYFREEVPGENETTAAGEVLSTDATEQPLQQQTQPQRELSWDDLFAQQNTTATTASGETEPTEEPTIKKLPQNQWYVN